MSLPRFQLQVSARSVEVRDLALASDMAKDGNGLFGATMCAESTHLVTHQVYQI